MPSRKRKPRRTPAPEPQAADYRRGVILGLFLISGATALAYEVVWVRMLTLVFGATVLSVGSVLAAYMAGLALGAWFWSPRADRTARPLRMYALLELGVSGSALLTLLLFPAVQTIYRGLFVGGMSDFSVLSLARFVLCLPALLLPTFLMGGTLPVLARFYTESLARIGRGAGDLYSVNTFGAVLGTVLAGFVIIPNLGVKGTLIAAAALNVLVACTAYRLSLTAAPLPAETTPTARWRKLSAGTTVALVGFGVSGFAAMVLEVAWTRALIQIFGNSTYAFTTMLAAFLIGLAAGAAVCGRLIDRARYPFFIFAALELGIGVWAAVATPLIEWLPPIFLSVYRSTGGAFGALQVTQFVVCCLLMLPATMGLGAVFPVVSKIFSAHTDGAGRSVGVPYAANTLGTVLGSLLAGFVLLPQLGLELSILIAAGLNLAVCAAVLIASRQTVLRPARLAVLGALALFVCARLVFARLDPLVMTAGVYMYPEFFLGAESRNLSLAQVVQMKKVLYYREGYSASVAVIQLPDGGLSLQTNGKTDASTGDLSTQRALAHLPMLLKPDAKDVLVVGLASGCTVGSTLLHPVQRVECVEIEPIMTTAAGFFNPWNHQCLQDPRFVPVLQDARNFVMMTNRQYDMITAEPTNPWIAGVNNLFTIEYYRHCRARLRPGGIMCQWLPAYNFTVDELQTALATYASAFPYVSVWSFPRMRSDLFALGSDQPIHVSPAAVAAALQGPVRADLLTMGVANVWEFLGALVQDAEIVRKGSGGTLNTDEHPRLEFSTPKHLYEKDLQLETMRWAYVGVDQTLSRMPLVAGEVRDWLEKAGLRLSDQVRLNSAQFIPHHVDPVSPPGTRRDTAEIMLSVDTPSGPATLRVAPLPRDTWPESLAKEWPDVGPEWQVDQGVGTARATRQMPGTNLAVRWEVEAGDTTELGKLTDFVEAG